MRIGVNTGEVIAHALDEGHRHRRGGEHRGALPGPRRRRAASSSASAPTATRGTAFAFDRPRRGDGQGRSTARSACDEVDGEGGPSVEAAAALETPFVGRDAEMELLRLLFARTVRERRPNLVTIVGPPGIGKSRLSHEVARALAAEGPGVVVRGRCLPYGDGLTYWPLAEILKADAGILDSDPPATILEKARARLDPRFPGEEGIGVVERAALLDRRRGALGPARRDGSGRGAAGDRPRVAALPRVDGRRSGPLVALIEDIHWADPSLLELIETVVVARAPAPRSCSAWRGPTCSSGGPSGAAGSSNATSISLSPLSAGDGADADRASARTDEAPAEVVGPILHRSEGNPFFAGELLRMMIEDGTLARRDGRWTLVRALAARLPDTVQGVIASRIDLLAPGREARDPGRVVVGRVFWPGALARLGGAGAGGALDGSDRQGSRPRARRDRRSRGERELIFNHILTRDVAYASIPRARRAEAHAVVGAWVEEETAGRDEEFAEILAYHFELAGDRRAHRAVRAARRATVTSACSPRSEAIELVRPRARCAAKTDADTSCARIGLARGGAREQIGRSAEALEAYEDAARDAAARRRSRARGASARGAGARPVAARPVRRGAGAAARGARAREGRRARRRRGAAPLYGGDVPLRRGEFSEALPLHEQALASRRRAATSRARRSRITGCARPTSSCGRSSPGSRTG